MAIVLAWFVKQYPLSQLFSNLMVLIHIVTNATIHLFSVLASLGKQVLAVFTSNQTGIRS